MQYVVIFQGTMGKTYTYLIYGHFPKINISYQGRNPRYNVEVPNTWAKILIVQNKNVRALKFEQFQLQKCDWALIHSLLISTRVTNSILTTDHILGHGEDVDVWTDWTHGLRGIKIQKHQLLAYKSS